jgi:hypothetical protein
MLQEAFVEATGAGVIAFQLVDTLPVSDLRSIHEFLLTE